MAGLCQTMAFPSCLPSDLMIGEWTNVHSPYSPLQVDCVCDNSLIILIY